MTTDQKRRELSTAIKAKRSVTFTYKDELREGNPHTLGYLDSEDAQYAVRLYQTDGASTSQPIIKPIEKDKEGENFRLFLISEMDNIEKTRETFTPHPVFKSKDEMFNWKTKGDYKSIEVSTND